MRSTPREDRQTGLFHATSLDSVSENEMQYLPCVPAQTAIEAIIDEDARNWRQGSEGHLIFGDPGTTYVSMGDPRVALTSERIATAWTKILALDDDTAQTFLYVMGRDLANEAPGEKTRIHVNDILDYKGFKRHPNRDFKQAQKIAEVERLSSLNEMWFSVNDEVRFKAGKQVRTKKIKLISRVIELEVETERDDSLDRPSGKAAAAAKFRPFAFRVRLGGWALPYRAFPTYVREILQRIVQYDASRESQRYAMRIALCLMFTTTDQRKHWRLRDLLEKARIPLPSRHPERLREAIENAFDHLEKDRLIGAWAYQNDVTLPTYRWLSAWLDWEVVLSPRPLKASGAKALVVPAARHRRLTRDVVG